jgi:hypothetical protein
MCADMLLGGVVAGKIWLYADPDVSYRVRTPNHPRCQVEWLYHVAPIVRVGDGIDGLRVIDPSLFGEPVHPLRWVGCQHPGGTMVFSDLRVFDRLHPDARALLDATGDRTRQALATFRAKLVRRVRYWGQAPPYC